MSQFSFFQIAHAEPAETTANEVRTETVAEPKHAEGLSIQPTTVAFQALNFVILLVVLNLILYKPLTKLLKERGEKIKEGVENADKAQLMLNEANTTRADMIKQANVESRDMMEKARKAGEELKTGIVEKAHKEADHIIQSGHQLVEMEKAKTLQELKGKAVGVIMMATEKILREKLDSQKDQKMIEESLNALQA